MRRLRLLLMLLAFVPATRAQDDSAVPLPPFIVEEMAKGPPWRYGQLAGFEILSRCGDRTTRELAIAHYRLHQLLALLVPPALQVSFALPRAVIFYDAALQSPASQEVIADMLKSAEKDAIALDPPDAMPFARRGGPVDFRPGRRINFLPNLRLWDEDAMMVFALVRDGGYDSDQLVLTREYLTYLLINRTPALPAWYAAGVQRLYERVEYDPNSLTLRALEWPTIPPAADPKKDPKGGPPLFPLAEFFSTVVPLGHDADSTALRERWMAQAALFVRWSLDGRTPAQRAAFFEFVARASDERVSARRFRETFGLEFTEADAQLLAYLPAALRKSFTLRLERSLKAPEFGLRDATDVEISRLKGDWERLEVTFVKNRSAGLAEKYREQARRTLNRAYDRGARDPDLLANIALCECDAGDAGDLVRARQLLESAAARGPIRPRANYELARLRWREMAAAPEGANGRLSAEQLTQIFTPLYAARTQAPPIPEVYELIARGWLHSAVKPTRGHLAVLDEGVRFFPRRLDLLYDTASLYAAGGFADEAAAMISLALHVVAEDAARARFVALKEQLAAAARKE